MADLGIEGRRNLEIKLDGLLKGVSNAEVTKILSGVGSEIKKSDMPEGFRQDLGFDKAMSNWPTRAKDPIELMVAYDITVGGPNGASLTIKPQGRAYGPLSMLESGRKVRRSGQFRSRGGYTNKAGESRTRIKQLTRNVGPMAPKGTWSDGAEIVSRRMGYRLKSWHNAVVRQSKWGM